MQIPPIDTELRQRPHSTLAARPQRAHGVLEDRTALPRHVVQTPSHGVVLVYVQNDRRHMPFLAITQRAHSVDRDCTARTSTIYFWTQWERCKDATLV